MADGQRLKRREWDGEAVLFNDLSGATHLLSPTAVWLLERLAEAPDDVPGLAAALEAVLTAELAEERSDGIAGDAAGDTAVDHAQLAALLADLQALDLIEPC